MPRNKSKQARRAEEWAKRGKGVNWDVTWKVFASIFSFAISMVAVYELVNYFRSDTQTFVSLIFPGFALIIWLIILYQLLRKKNPYSILLLAVTILGGVVGGIGWQSYNQTQEDKVIVLIAKFDGPEETYGLQRQMMEDLREATKDYDDTVIIEGDQLVTSSEYARELGDKAKADLVIWAWYRPTENPNITIHIENLSPTEFITLKEGEIYQPQATLAQLESFEIQKQIGSETSTLVSFLTGTLRFKSGDFQTTINRFEQILNSKDVSTYIDPHILYSTIGFSYLQKEEVDPAIEYYSRAIEFDPNNAFGYYDRGVAFFEKTQYEQAIQDYSRAIEINPYFSDAYANRGTIYLIQEDHKLAIQDFNKAIEINPGDDIAYFNRAISHYFLKEYELAISDFNNIIALNPQDSQSYYLRGLSYQALGKTAEAEADFKKYEELTGQKP